MTVDFFNYYYIVAMNSDNITFYAYEIIKVKSGFNCFASWHQHPKKQLKYFSNKNNSTTLTLPGPPGVSREAKSSTEFEFGNLVH